MVKELRQQYGDITARALAARLGIHVTHAVWQVAAERLLWLAECTREPLQITLNDAALERLARAEVAASEQCWFTRAQIAEVIIAHELFHLLTPPPSGWSSSTKQENQAHAFAQRWTGLPFHPTRYEQILWATF